MPNPLDQVTQDMRDDEGRPLRRIVITGAEAPVDNSETDVVNRLEQAVAPAPGQPTDIMALIAKVRDYLANAGTGILDQVGVAGVEPGPVRDAAVTGRNSLVGLAGPENDLWPVRMVKSGATLPGEVSQGIVPTFDPETGRTSVPMIERAQDTAGMAMPGGLAQKPGTATLGSGPVRQGVAAAPEAAPVFYSALEHVVSNSAQDAMSPQQWQGFLKNQPGLKNEELGWTGVNDWLAQQKGKVSKEDVQAYLDEHKVEVKDVTKSRRSVDELERDFEGDYDPEVVTEMRRRNRNLPDENSDQFAEIYYNTQADMPGNTKYSDYQLPGGENYREHLLTLPPRPGPKWSIADEAQFSTWDKIKQQGKQLPPDVQAEYDALLAKRQQSPEYTSSHWDEPNVLAHVRTNERDVGGQPSLHIEEIQSDWHQQGRKQGYQQKFTKNDVKERIGPAGDKQYYIELPEAQGGRTLHQDTPEDAIKAAEHVMNVVSGPRIPDAPFKTAWPELALKRMIRLAADEGKTRISWTPGEAQAARYDLSKQVEAIRAKLNPDGKTFSITGKKKTESGTHWTPLNDVVPSDKLGDFVGKDLAEKIMNDYEGHFNSPNASNKSFIKDYSGLDLKVGGEGMKGFYDNMLPKMVEKLGKAHGVKVKKAEVTGKYHVNDAKGNRVAEFGSEADAKHWLDMVDKDMKAGFKLVPDAQPVYYFDIPPAWRDQAVGKGFPLYMQGIPFPLTPVDYDPFKDLGKEKMRTIARGANDRNALQPLDIQASRVYGPDVNQEDH